MPGPSFAQMILEYVPLMISVFANDLQNIIIQTSSETNRRFKGNADWHWCKTMWCSHLCFFFIFLFPSNSLTSLGFICLYLVFFCLLQENPASLNQITHYNFANLPWNCFAAQHNSILLSENNQEIKKNQIIREYDDVDVIANTHRQAFASSARPWIFVSINRVE